MKKDKLTFGNLRCLCYRNEQSKNVAYILYPMDILGVWIEKAATEYGTTIVVISGMDWNNDLTPWPAQGVPEGSPDFKGFAPRFLNMLTTVVIPDIEKCLGLGTDIERTLIGVSLSGLFTLWQWAQTNFFHNIATLSGSFWYEGFVQWIFQQSFSSKTGRCYMLLGDAEPHSKDPMFRQVGKCTEEIVGCLHRQKVYVTYEMVSGNHYQHPIYRLETAFTHLFK